MSWTIYSQCKRYKDSGSSGAVGDFRGAMSGHWEEGLLITTGIFTASAKDGDTRDGASSVELVDGARLCDLLRDYGLRRGLDGEERLDIACAPPLRLSRGSRRSWGGFVRRPPYLRTDVRSATP